MNWLPVQNTLAYTTIMTEAPCKMVCDEISQCFAFLQATPHTTKNHNRTIASPTTTLPSLNPACTSSIHFRVILLPLRRFVYPSLLVPRSLASKVSPLATGYVIVTVEIYFMGRSLCPHPLRCGNIEQRQRNPL
jgi:hypothetical protein